MKYLKLFTLCGLLAAGVTSCTESTEDIIVPVVEQPTEAAELADNEFKIGNEEVVFDHAYLNTNKVNDQYQHLLVLTVGDVQEGNELTGTTPHALEFRFNTEAEMPEGDISRQLTSTSAGLTFFGYKSDFNFSDSYWEIANNRISAGAISIANVDGRQEINVDLAARGSYGVTGKLTLPVTQVSGQPEINNAPVTDADFSGTPGITVSEGDFPLTNAYLKYDETYARYELFLSTSDVQQVENTLVGTGDALMVRFPGSGEGGITTGRYHETMSSFNGYFGRRAVPTDAQKEISAFFCRQINYVSGRMDDDEPMGGGEAIIQTDGETFRASFTFQSRRGNTVKGLYEGVVQNIDN